MQASEPNDHTLCFPSQSTESIVSTHAQESTGSAETEPNDTCSQSEKPDSVVGQSRKRARTEKENGEMYGHQVQLLIPMTSSGPYNTLRTHKIASYHLTETETKTFD